MVCDDSAITVELVYALPERQMLVVLTVPRDTTAHDAVVRSGLLLSHPEIDTMRGIGIFGKRVPPETILKNGDRIEIYRPLTADPKEARRRRAWKPK